MILHSPGPGFLWPVRSFFPLPCVPLPRTSHCFTASLCRSLALPLVVSTFIDPGRAFQRHPLQTCTLRSWWGWGLLRPTLVSRTSACLDRCRSFPAVPGELRVPVPPNVIGTGMDAQSENVVGYREGW